MIRSTIATICALSVLLAGCTAFDGAPGPQGVPGADGPAGHDGADGKGVAISGGRIKARRIVASDGAMATIGWFDSALKMPCSFLKAGDGHLRCLPTIPRSDLVRVFYDNSECAGDAIAVGVRQESEPCATFGTYVADSNVHGCDSPTVIYESGGAFMGDSPVFYTDGGACVSMGVPSPTFDLYNAIVVDPATTFIEAEETIE